MRKAPCHFGWDWGPKLPPIGIWRDLRLEGYQRGAAGRTCTCASSTAKAGVSASADVQAEAWDGANR